MRYLHKSFSIRNVRLSFKHAFRGIKLVFRFEYNLYIHLFFALIAILFGIVYKISIIDWSLQTIVIGLVIFSELVNTAIEKIMDFIQPGYNEKVKDIKDLSAGAVLFTVGIAICVGLLIYIPKIFL